VHVIAPASSANLGPGFDCLGLALDLPFELADVQPDEPGFLLAEPTHPAVVAFVAAGGAADATLWWRSPIPPGRGLGFSGAARVAGAYLAIQRGGVDHGACRAGAMRVAALLEGHADNAAASTFGGCTVAVGEQVVAVPVAEGLLEQLRVVVWSPARSTSTDASRRVLPEQLPLVDATFSIGRAALWVAALASGELSMLRTASQDRVHQPARLAARPDTSAAYDAAMAAPAVLACWLSGSGPSIAALVRSDDDVGCAALVDELTAVSGDEGRVRTLVVDVHGVRSLGPQG